MVYLGSMDGFLYALDAATGKRIWQFKTREQPLAPPALSAGTLFVGSTEGILYALHARTGYTRPAFSRSRPITGLAGRRQRTGVLPRRRKIYAVAADAREIPGQYELQLVWAQLWIRISGASWPPSQPGRRWRFSPFVCFPLFSLGASSGP